MSAVQHAAPPAPQSQSSLSFTQGFLLGQLSLVILIGAFIKFFIFGDPPSADTTASLRASARRERTLAHKRSLLTLQTQSPQHRLLRKKRSGVLRNPPPLTIGTILSKTYYNVDSHQPESLDWFNVLIAQTIAQFRDDAQQDDAILASLTSALNSPLKPDFLDEIKVTEISLGEDFPIFSNCRIISVDDEVGMAGGPSRLQARMDVDLSDLVTLGVETKLVLNYPKPMVAVLPVALAVSVVRFSGTLSISFLPSSPPGGPSPTTLAFSFLDDYRLDLSIRSLVGSRSRLQDVPKVAQLVEARLHTWFDERCVEPRFQQIVLPSLWPRKKNTRGGEEEKEAGPESTVRAVSEGKVQGDSIRSRRGEPVQEGLNMPGSLPGMTVT
ncbi:MAG: ERMES complex subunit mmm1 [Candelina mexicana]|nr:MAG: ERMES complex subunit mmm1 [Candelina mexicana]